MAVLRMAKSAYLKNLVFSYLPFAVQIGVTVLVTPYAVHILGEFEYGVFVLFHTVLAYLGIANIGIPQAMMRRLIASPAAGGRIKDAGLVASVFYFYLGMTVVVGFAIGVIMSWGTAGPLHYLVTTPAAMRFLQQMTLVIFLTFAAELLRQVFDTIIMAQNKVYLTKLLMAGLLLFRGIAMYLVLWYELRIYSVVVAQMLITGLFAVVFWLAAKREMDFSLNPRLFRWALIKDIMPDSFWYLVSGLAVLLIFQTDSFIISAFISVSAITGYALVYRFVGLVGQMLSNIVAVLFPEVARMFAEEQYRQILRLHDRLLVYMIGIALVSFGGLYLVGEQVFAWWMGDLLLFDRGLFVIFLITNALLVISIPATYFLGAVGWHRFSTTLAMGQGVLNLALSIALVGSYGLIGIALGTFISFLLTSCWANILFFRKKIKALAGTTAPEY